MLKKIMLKLSARAAKVQSLYIFILCLRKSKTRIIHSKQTYPHILKEFWEILIVL